ncbi:MAG: type II secretion system protein GspF [Gammaproteobacteria bacterium RIFCSPHIGHO2_02_FULL_39_13]|nr:MAG: type II secretion system protein GspF [Gammaproteobacteria bacterium RIFCSPHIGHO2_02_FULL_39_13]OGT50311.1 MAG: type II secretion system protein GspF [Gammaproteobacteria bacterium RIFCSPHIGHO2_12_FULL_39_24]
MTAFQYIALDKNGKRVKGVAEDDSARGVRQQLRDKQLTPVSVDVISGSVKTEFRFGARKLSAADLSLITRQMATLLQAGIPVDEMLTAVSEQTEKQSVKEILLGVRAKVLEGYALADGMMDFPAAFPVLYQTTVAAGERSGKLGQVLDQLAEYTEKQHYIRQKVKQALVYPIMMTSVSLSIVVFLLIYVVPKIIAVFNQTNQVLPLSTEILIAISNFVAHFGLYVLGFIIIFIFLWTRALKRKNFRRKVHVLMLKIPVIGRAIKTINGARFGRTLGILNAAAVPVLDAMHASVALVKPLPMSEKIEQAITQVREGASISVALQKTGCFAPMFVHLVSSGESSGQLDLMLEKGASYLEKDVEGLIQTALTLFEPLMILVMGGIVLYIVLAIMLPIFALDQVS